MSIQIKERMSASEYLHVVGTCLNNFFVLESGHSTPFQKSKGRRTTSVNSHTRSLGSWISA